MEQNELKTEIIDDFVQEAKEHLQQIEKMLLEIENSEDWLYEENISQLFRSLHTIKGNASFLGLNQIVVLAHMLENVVGEYRDQLIVPDKDSIDLLMEGRDLLKAQIFDISNLDNIEVESCTNSLIALYQKLCGVEQADENSKADEADPECSYENLSFDNKNFTNLSVKNINELSTQEQIALLDCVRLKKESSHVQYPLFFQKSDNAAVRLKALKTFVEISPELALFHVMQALDDQEISVRSCALSIVGTTKKPLLVDKVKNYLINDRKRSSIVDAMMDQLLDEILLLFDAEKQYSAEFLEGLKSSKKDQLIKNYRTAVFSSGNTALMDLWKNSFGEE